jgi:hypothetical protein
MAVEVRFLDDCSDAGQDLGAVLGHPAPGNRDRAGVGLDETE